MAASHRDHLLDLVDRMARHCRLSRVTPRLIHMGPKTHAYASRWSTLHGSDASEVMHENTKPAQNAVLAEFGRRICDRREAVGLSQGAAAVALGIHLTQLGKSVGSGR